MKFCLFLTWSKCRLSPIILNILVTFYSIVFEIKKKTVFKIMIFKQSDKIHIFSVSILKGFVLLFMSDFFLNETLSFECVRMGVWKTKVHITCFFGWLSTLIFESGSIWLIWDWLINYPTVFFIYTLFCSGTSMHTRSLTHVLVFVQQHSAHWVITWAPGLTFLDEN